MKMPASGADSTLLLDAERGLSGILTDNEVTRRLVSQFRMNTADISA